MAGKYLCTANRPPAGKVNSYVEAANEAEALRQFREEANINKWEALHSDKPKIAVDVQLVEELPDANGKLASEVEAVEVEEIPQMTPAVAPAIEPLPIVAVKLDDLKNFGLDDRQVTGLRAGKLLTLDAIIEYAKGGKRFGELPGLRDADEMAIRNAVRAARHGN